jgi:hypothetical protein
MYSELYRYFILHKELSIPGIGSFFLNTHPSEYDFPSKSILPPSYSISFQSPGSAPARNFFEWLGEANGISDREAVIRYNDFVFDLKKQLADGCQVNWKGIGTLQAGPGGEIKFVPGTAVFTPEEPVPAEKLIRKDARHSIRVGEDERTSDEMTERLHQAEAKSSNWWALALLIGLLGIIFTGWYFSHYGVKVSVFGNRQTLTPAEMTATHQDLK